MSTVRLRARLLPSRPPNYRLTLSSIRLRLPPFFHFQDYWGANGANEMDGNHLKDLGFSQADLDAQVAAFNWAQSIVYAETLKRNRFIWDQFLNHDPYAPENGDCPQPWVRQKTCASDLRSLCNATSEVQTRALLYGFSPGSCTGTDPAHLTDLEQDVANFLLVRGPYAYLGNGCVLPRAAQSHWARFRLTLNPLFLCFPS